MTVLDLSARQIEFAPAPADLRLLTLDALADAAGRLPPDRVEHHLGDTIPTLLPDGRIRTLPTPAAEVVRTVATNRCWVMLTSLASLPEYEPVLRRLGAPLQLAVRVTGEQPVAHDLIGFIGAPRANVPLHFDRNHHLLVQTRGTKTVGVGYFDDPHERHRQIERGMQAHRLNADRAPDRTEVFALRPGQALLLPAFTFHWVEGADDVSIAVACVLTTDATRRRVAASRLTVPAG